MQQTQMYINTEMYHAQAKKMLSKMAYEYYYTGADDQHSLQEQFTAFQRIKLIPRVLVNIILAPWAFQKLAHPHGEAATAKAAQEMKTCMILSSASTSALDEIATSAPTGLRWFQLYVPKNRQFTLEIVQNAEKHGYKALVVTVDRPRLGNRESDQLNQFGLPDTLNMEILKVKTSELKTFLDDGMTWEDIEWLKSVTKLPILLKGIVSEIDAVLAVKHGVAGIVVSNHGARQLDTCIPTIEALPRIVNVVRAMGSNMDVYVDGGIRRGTDVFKAIALGAKAVFVGRPIIWGLTVEGTKGVQNVLAMLFKEFELTMALCGCTKLSDIHMSHIQPYWNTSSTVLSRL